MMQLMLYIQLHLQLLPFWLLLRYCLLYTHMGVIRSLQLITNPTGMHGTNS